MFLNLKNGVNGATWKWMAHETGHLFGQLDEEFDQQSHSLGFTPTCS
jgi:hypothetical protein